MPPKYTRQLVLKWLFTGILFCSNFLDINSIFSAFFYVIYFMLSSEITAWKMTKYEVISGPYFSVSSLNTGKYGPEITPYLGTFQVVKIFSWRIRCVALDGTESSKETVGRKYCECQVGMGKKLTHLWLWNMFMHVLITIHNGVVRSGYSFFELIILHGKCYTKINKLVTSSSFGKFKKIIAPKSSNHQHI